MKEVLDTRFLVEHFYSAQAETEKKTEKIEELITKNNGIILTIVVAEIIQITCQKRGKDMAESRY